MEGEINAEAQRFAETAEKSFFLCASPRPLRLCVQTGLALVASLHFAPLRGPIRFMAFSGRSGPLAPVGPRRSQFEAQDLGELPDGFVKLALAATPFQVEVGAGVLGPKAEGLLELCDARRALPCWPGPLRDRYAHRVFGA